MAVYGFLNEGLIKDLKSQLRDLRDKYNKEKEKKTKPTKVVFTDEQIKERNRLVTQINSLAKYIVDKYSRNKAMNKKLAAAVYSDLPEHDEESGFDLNYQMTYVEIGFEYQLSEDNNFINRDRYDPSVITISVITEDLESLLFYYKIKCMHYDEQFPKTTALVKPIYEEIVNRIENNVKSDILSISFYAGELGGDNSGLSVIFAPKKG